MPIEIWWWMKPLFYTGWLTLIVLGLASIGLDKVKPGNFASIIMIVLAVAPWLACFGAFLVWLVANILILIWGR